MACRDGCLHNSQSSHPETFRCHGFPNHWGRFPLVGLAVASPAPLHLASLQAKPAQSAGNRLLILHCEQARRVGNFQACRTLFFHEVYCTISQKLALLLYRASHWLPFYLIIPLRSYHACRLCFLYPWSSITQ